MSFEDPNRLPYFGLYKDKTFEKRRPTGNESEFRHLSDRVVQQHQDAWDAARALHDNRNNMYAGIAARAAKASVAERRQKEQREADARAKSDAAILEPAMRAFRQSGGTEAEFESLKGEILADARRAAALAAATKVAAAEEPRSNLRQYL